MVGKNEGKRSKEESSDEIEPIIEDLELDGSERLSEQKVKKLRVELKACQEEKQQYLDGWQREKADLLNMRRRLAEETTRERERIVEEHIKRLLPLCDSFLMAMSDTKAWESADPVWRKGIEQIHTQLASILTSYGVSEVGMIGESFDPNVHEAVSSQSVEDKKADHTVVAVYQKGYRMGERLIRPAKVIVGAYND